MIMLLHDSAPKLQIDENNYGKHKLLSMYFRVQVVSDDYDSITVSV